MQFILIQFKRQHQPFNTICSQTACEPAFVMSCTATKKKPKRNPFSNKTLYFIFLNALKTA